jgi:hypothetical protein
VAHIVRTAHRQHILTAVALMMPFDKTGVMILSPKLFFSHGKLNISILECNLCNGINISVDHDFIKQVVY